MKKRKIKLKFNKFFKSLIVLSVVLVISLSSSVFAFADSYWHGDGIVLNIFSSFYWDYINGSTRVYPTYDSSHNHASFEVVLDEGTTVSELYIFADVVELESFYGWLHFEVVGHKGTSSFDLSRSGLYEYTGEEIDFGNPLLPFENIGNSDIALHLTNRYPLPKKICIFLSYQHSWHAEVEVATFNLSFTQEYPYIDTKDYQDSLQSDEELVTFVSEKLRSSMAQTDSLNVNNNITQVMKNGTLAMGKLLERQGVLIPDIQKLLNLSFCLGFFAFLCGAVTVVHVKRKGK